LWDGAVRRSPASRRRADVGPTESLSPLAHTG
jgi:hypothetical protein